MLRWLKRRAPSNILGVTFTKKAAREMNDRVGELLERKPAGLTLSTFHALGFRILREQAEAAGLKHGFDVLTGANQLKVVSQAAAGQVGDLEPRLLAQSISRAKSLGIGPDHLRKAANGNRLQLAIAQTYARYQSELARRRLVDFDDLLLRPVKLLEAKRHREIKRRYQQRWRYILVDEYQDTNALQYRLMRALVGPAKNICVVGDDDQSIYGWRGADRQKILRFEQDFPTAKRVMLEQNYRSTPQIIALANAVIQGSAERYPKRLQANRSGGVRVAWREEGSEAAEASFVARKVRQLGLPYSNVAVLVRVHKDACLIREALEREKIPCKIRTEEDKPHGGVTVMTLHASKGLEFPVVFLPFVGEHTLPHFNPTSSVIAVSPYFSTLGP